MFLQRTIRRNIEVKGIGLHSGKPCSVVFKPAPVNTGVYFIRTDLPNNPAITARTEFVKETYLATTLSGGGFSISTVEHCLSSLAALRIDNIYIEISGDEIPILDGSADIFCKSIIEAGIWDQEVPRKYAYIVKPIYVGNDEKYAYILPYNGLRLTCTIDFPHPLIGKQKIDLEINEHSFINEISRARTFGFFNDIEKIKSKGLIQGGSLDNAVVLDNDSVLNHDGLRYHDEFVRHKALDALGDLVTVGMPIMGHLIVYKAGHEMMNQLVNKIISSPNSYRYIELGSDFSQELIWKNQLSWAFS